MTTNDKPGIDTIQRYDMSMGLENIEGDWVRYEDHLRAMEAAKAEIEDWKSRDIYSQRVRSDQHDQIEHLEQQLAEAREGKGG